MTIVLVSLSYLVMAQTITVEDIMTDIYNQLSEYGIETSVEDVQEQLTELISCPINLNQTNAEELQRLFFLSDEQIDAILLYQYKHPFQSVYELQLIPELKDYDIRNLLPFVQAGPVAKDDKLYFREVFHYAKHEMTFRVDARDCENLIPDPFYGKFRYRFNYNNRVQMGLTLCRPTGEPFRNMQYGGYVQLRDIGPFTSIVAGDFQATFGQGLVLGSPFRMGKTAYLSSVSNQQEGLRKYTSVGSGYSAMHGIGATARVRWADISALYSLKKQNDSTWHHVIGANVTGRWKRLKVGLTAIENLYSGAVQDPQVVLGVNARYNFGIADLWGEVATTQGKNWGVGAIAGVRLTPMSGIGLLAITRYYSAAFNNKYAYSLSEHSTLNDESGFYVGAEITSIPHCRLAAYADGFNGGYDAMIQADFLPKEDYSMTWRVRVRNNDGRQTYAFRYQFTYEALSQWRFRTQLDANAAKTDSYLGKADAIDPQHGIGHGFSVFQDIEYHLTRVPIVLQWRMQAFDARLWYNRIYAYENDVLYACSFPNVYGVGGRFYLNARYAINDIFSLYLRVLETVYSPTWAATHQRTTTRTDVHVLLRVKL